MAVNNNSKTGDTFVSIVMPCFNSALTIKNSVASVYNQTFKNFELIIVDDGSTDNSRQVINELEATYPNIKSIFKSNSGPAQSRNVGIQAASGQFIAFLDSDDTWHPEFLEKLLGCLEQNPDCKLAYCGWQNIGLAADRCKPYIPPDYETSDKASILLKSCPWPIHAVIARKQEIDRVKGFNDAWFTAEDFDMWLRIALFGKIVRVPEVLSYYHHKQGEQITRNRLRAILNHLGVQKAFLKDFPRIEKSIGKQNCNKLIYEQILYQAYELYWAGELGGAQILFRKAFISGQFKPTDLKYIIPAWLPSGIYLNFIGAFRKQANH
ncbi:glycosyltransferase family 2 protein [Methylomonas koyamae]|uniref:glycosyltransferase family 2 protein n=1 Tax=Methylomonas koyamae TaxID=702114 RepID=UPI0021B4AC7C|nr:glycosyltransferase family A protein [Methylomonas koyamae]